MLSSDPIWRQLLLQAALIFLNAFFASTEIAILTLNENRLRYSAAEGDKKASRLLKIIDQPTVFLSTIQIGITLAGFLGSAFAADNFAGRLTDWFVNTLHFTAISEDVLNTISIIVITLLLSYFTLVLGELVPKRLAMQRPQAIANVAAGIVHGFSVVMRPITWLLSVSTNGVLRLFRIDLNKEDENVSEDEIRMMVDIGEEKGAIESNEKTMIENIFEFNNITAADVMVHRTDMEVIWLDNTPEEILSCIKETGLSRFPVCNEDVDDIVGLLSTREYLLNAQAEHPKPLKKILRTVYFVPEYIHTDVLFRNMQSKKIHMAIVVDEYGGVSGLVTMEDLLERIVGNIYDEFDPLEEHEITRINDAQWRISGSADLKSVSKELNINLPEEEYETLGGLILDCLEAIPEDGSKPVVDAMGLHIEVQEIKDRRIEWALVSVVPQKPSENAEEKEA